MVITSPFSSIKGYIVTKPPLVLFTLCLMVFAVTTFSFAYYMEHNEHIPNTDAHRDWASFLKHLNKMEYCIEPNDTAAVTTKSAVNFVNNTNSQVELITVAVTTDINISDFNNVRHLKGDIYIKDWNRECPGSVRIEKVHISFSVLNNIYNHTNIMSVCVLMTGPKDLLEIATARTHCDDISTNNDMAWNSTANKNVHKINTCSKGNTVKMNFKSSDYDGLLLSVKDRTIINLHLLHTSYFLLVMAITLICYAMIKGKPSYAHQLLDNTSLQI